jgi:hypothetical protein
LLLTGCLSRTNLGAEPVPDAGLDSGLAPNPPADASIEDEVIGEFERALVGKWQGVYYSALAMLQIEFEFMPDHTYRVITAGKWRQSGSYRITDVLLDGTAVLQIREQDEELIFYDVSIHRDVLRFNSPRLPGVSERYELRRVERLSSDEL